MKIIKEEKELIDAFDEMKRVRDYVYDDSEVLDSLLDLLNPSELEPLVKRLVDRLGVKTSPLYKDYKKPEKDVPVRVYNIEYYHDNDKLPDEIELNVTFDPEKYDTFDDAVDDQLDMYINDLDSGNFATRWRVERK